MKKKCFIFLLVVITTMLYFMANLQRTAVPGTIFDYLQIELKTNAASITAFGAVFTYFYAISQFFAGIFVAKYGGFRVINMGAIVFALGCLIFPFSNSLLLFYVSRGLIGLGSATFYLGMIQETQKVVAGKNFSVVLSFMLLIGYIGGIVAGAPLTIGVQNIGWRNLFSIFGIITVIICIIYNICKKFVVMQETDENVHFNFNLFKKSILKKENWYIYVFGCLNYAIYFVLQTVFGKKFFEDFVQISAMQAAVMISVMSTIYAFSGTILAFFSRLSGNRRAIFLKIAAINTFVVIFLICLCTAFDVKSAFIPFAVCELSCFASLSPLLIPIIYDINGAKEASISISVMTTLFFLIVAVISNILGLILSLIPPEILENGVSKYPTLSYLRIFIFMTILAIISLVCACKIQETNKTKRFLNICNKKR